jgi:hypothetical protein
MKQLFFIAALGLTLASCGSSSSNEVATSSTNDSTMVCDSTVCDSTVCDTAVVDTTTK